MSVGAQLVVLGVVGGLVVVAGVGSFVLNLSVVRVWRANRRWDRQVARSIREADARMDRLFGQYMADYSSWPAAARPAARATGRAQVRVVTRCTVAGGPGAGPVVDGELV